MLTADLSGNEWILFNILLFLFFFFTTLTRDLPLTLRHTIAFETKKASYVNSLERFIARSGKIFFLPGILMALIINSEGLLCFL